MPRRRPALAGWPYRCPKCKQILRRESLKAWIKSYCDRSGGYARLQRLPRKEPAQ